MTRFQAFEQAEERQWQALRAQNQRAVAAADQARREAREARADGDATRAAECEARAIREQNRAYDLASQIG